MNKLETRRGLRYRFDMDDEHDEAERLISNASAISRHRVHDQAIARGMAAAMRGVMVRLESAERAIGLQAEAIERMTGELDQLRQQHRGAAGDVIEQVMQPTMQPGAIDAG